MRRALALMSLLSLFGAASAAEYEVGQVWSYKTRPGEEASTLLIDKIEANEKLGSIYHITIEAVKVRNPFSRAGISTELPHAPVSQVALDQSVIKLVGHRRPNPGYLEGYKTWKTAFDAHRGGIFTISVADVVSTIEQALDQSWRKEHGG